MPQPSQARQKRFGVAPSTTQHVRHVTNQRRLFQPRPRRGLQPARIWNNPTTGTRINSLPRRSRPICSARASRQTPTTGTSPAVAIEVHSPEGSSAKTPRARLASRWARWGPDRAGGKTRCREVPVGFRSWQRERQRPGDRTQLARAEAGALFRNAGRSAAAPRRRRNGPRRSPAAPRATRIPPPPVINTKRGGRTV